MPNSLVIVFATSRETSLTGECASRSSWFQGTGVKFVEQEKRIYTIKIKSLDFLSNSTGSVRIRKTHVEYFLCYPKSLFTLLLFSIPYLFVISFNHALSPQIILHLF